MTSCVCSEMSIGTMPGQLHQGAESGRVTMDLHEGMEP